MKKKLQFGIISGAGPMAGALLYQRVIEKLQQQGAWQDSDFPEILLINVPFSEMLLGDINADIIRDELVKAVKFISQTAGYVYIACQTLHGFLTLDELEQYNIVSLLSLTKQVLLNKSEILVVASKTSRLFDLHTKHLGKPCQYVEHQLSERAIDDILKGKSPDLAWLEKLAENNHVVLGCTEFSVATQKSRAKFIDPIELAADDILKKFESERNYQDCKK